MFIIKVTSHAFMFLTHYSDLIFFSKACCMPVLILIWVGNILKEALTHIFICPLPFWEPSWFSTEQALSRQCLSTCPALWLGVSHRWFPTQKLWEGTETANFGEVLLPCMLPMTSHSSGIPAGHTATPNTARSIRKKIQFAVLAPGIYSSAALLQIWKSSCILR